MALEAIVAMVTGTLISHSMEDTYSPGFTEICGCQFPDSKSITPAIYPHHSVLWTKDFFFIYFCDIPQHVISISISQTL